MFLARANEGGILGAYTIAFGISFANSSPESPRRAARLGKTSIRQIRTTAYFAGT